MRQLRTGAIAPTVAAERCGSLERFPTCQGMLSNTYPYAANALLPVAAPVRLVFATGALSVWPEAAPASSGALSARSCGDVRLSGQATRLRASGVSCRGARRVARAYDRKRDRGRGCLPDTGNTCPLRVGSFRCTTPSRGSAPLVLTCSSRKLGARIRGYED